MSPPAVALVGVGAVTPVGLSAETTCAALRAGIARIGDIESFPVDDAFAEPAPATGGRVPLEWFDGGPAEAAWPGHERFGAALPPPAHKFVANGVARAIELALPAAREAWDDAGGPEGGRVGLYLGLDAAEPAAPIADAVGRTLGVRWELERADRSGRASGLAAIHRAVRHLRADRIDVALVGAVDSVVRADRLAALAAAGRLRTETQPGLLPGEAAAFLVLVKRERARRSLGEILASATADEPTAGTDEPCKAVGLSRALREALGAVGKLSSRPRVLCDLNGDRYRAMEWALANVRTMSDLGTDSGPYPTDVWHPADCIGDASAASGGLNVVWGAIAMRRGYAGSDCALIWGASDEALRAAVVLGG